MRPVARNFARSDRPRRRCGLWRVAREIGCRIRLDRYGVRMNDASVPPAIDFSECEAERLDAPGAIQTFGWLVALDRRALRVTHLSPSAEAVFPPRAAGWLGASLTEVISAMGLSDISCEACVTMAARAGVTQPIVLAKRGRETDLVSAAVGHLLIERRVSDDESPPEPEALRSWQASLDLVLDEARSGPHELAHVVATRLRAILRFDRVMVYRFDRDWSGEVIADSHEADMPPYLGLHYPATDIPSQARKLYLSCRLREIANTAVPPERLIPDAHAEAADPLDLSTSVLRAISPYHLEYMRNLGIGATLVASVVVEGKLWGLIACHNRRACTVAFDLRMAAGHAAEYFGGYLEAANAAQAAARRERILSGFARARNIARRTGNRVRPLLESLLVAADADGAALVAGANAVTVGNTPEADKLTHILVALGAGDDPVVLDAPPATAVKSMGGAKGVAAVRLSGASPSWLLLFRVEYAHNVSWGGDPRRAALRDEDSGRLSPRRSFAIWTEAVRDRSRPWLPDTQELLRGLRDDPLALDAARDLAAAREADPAIAMDIHGVGRPFLDAASDAILVVARIGGAEPVVLDANSTFARMYLAGGEDVAGLPVGEILRRIKLPILFEALGNTTETVVWSRRDGVREVEIRRSIAFDLLIGGVDMRYELLVIRDRTSERRSERAQALAFHQVEKSARVKSELLANMSHELRTPLNAIIGYAQMLSMAIFGPIGHPKYGEYAADILAAGRHLLELIERVLIAAQLDAGKRVLDESDVDLVATVDAAIEWTKIAGGNKVPHIELLTPDGPVALRGDELSIKQIAINLITNAAKFSGAAGTVRVTVALDVDGSPTLQVTDDGPGIPPGYIERIFDAFEQGEGVYARSHGGVGLGLSIVRSLVELHGGRISVANRAEGGALATVIFPRSRRVAIK
ncbi:MAG: hypothetical protein C6Y20_21320 [Tagaea sp. CACIAM 22H2]|nr:hypothetical protein [Tagaea sp. CACIAM 22H2]